MVFYHETWGVPVNVPILQFYESQRKLIQDMLVDLQDQDVVLPGGLEELQPMLEISLPMAGFFHSHGTSIAGWFHGKSQSKVDAPGRSL